jgi:transposase-like protein
VLAHHSPDRKSPLQSLLRHLWYCERGTFICDYSYAGYSLQVKQQIGEMAINGSGIRDTARVLGISPTTVIENLKKKFQVASSE